MHVLGKIGQRKRTERTVFMEPKNQKISPKAAIKTCNSSALIFEVVLVKFDLISHRFHFSWTESLFTSC